MRQSDVRELYTLLVSASDRTELQCKERKKGAGCELCGLFGRQSRLWTKKSPCAWDFFCGTEAAQQQQGLTRTSGLVPRDIAGERRCNRRTR